MNGSFMSLQLRSFFGKDERHGKARGNGIAATACTHLGRKHGLWNVGCVWGFLVKSPLPRLLVFYPTVTGIMVTLAEEGSKRIEGFGLSFGSD